MAFSCAAYAQKKCKAGFDCVPVKYTQWCHQRGGGCGLGSPASTCPESNNSPGFRNYEDDTNWSIRVFKQCEGYVSGTASPAAAEVFTYQSWAEPISGVQRWNYQMVFSSGNTTVLTSNNGRQRSPYCPDGFAPYADGSGERVSLCARSRPAISPKNLGCCSAGKDGRSISAMVGNPINIAIGNKVQVEYDIAAVGRSPLRLTRTYNSIYAPYFASFGARWVGTYDRTLNLHDANGQIIAVRDSGRAYFFTLNGNDAVGDPDVPDHLTRLVDGGGAVIGWQYVNASDEIELYNPEGRLESIEDRDGSVQSLIYSDATTHHSIAPYPGLLIAVKDSWGRELRFAYDSRNRVSSVVDSGGKTILYSYDGQGNLTVRKSADGAERKYLYNEPEHRGSQSQPYALTGIVAEDGRRYATFKYAASGKAVSSEHADGADRTSVAYGSNGNATVTDALGAVRVYGFSTQFGVIRPTSVQEPCASCAGGVSTRTVTLDAKGYPDVSSDLAGTSADSDYDGRGLRTSLVESSNRVATKRTTQSDWHPVLRRETERRTLDASGTVVGRHRWAYNARGQVIRSAQVDPATGAERATTTAYCEQQDIDAGRCPLLGAVISVDGTRQDVADVTSYEYYMADAAGCSSLPADCAYRKGDLYRVVDALGQQTLNLRYDRAGRLLSGQDANGVVTDMEYNDRGWLMATKTRGGDPASEADDRITRFDYWPTGQVKRVTLPDGVITEYVYDAASRLVEILDAEGNKIRYASDIAGNREKEETLSSGGVLKRTMSRVFNQLNQLQASKDASQNATVYRYDVSGNNDRITDALGRVTDQTYDPLNRLVRTLQDAGGLNVETKFEYDALDRLTKVTDPKGLDTVYSFNGFGDQIRLTSPDTGITDYTYNAAGRVATKRDANDAVPHRYTYDALGRPKAVFYTDSGSADVEYDYDTVNSICTAGETFATGRVSAMRAEGTELKYCYDRFGQVVRKVQIVAGKSFSLNYTYTIGGQLSAVTYPDGAIVDYVRDAQARIKEIGVRLNGGLRTLLLSNSTYEPLGPVASWRYGNGRVLSRTYDLDYRAKTILDNASGGLSLGYGYNTVGELTVLKDGSQSTFQAKYDYDTLGRLTVTRDGSSNPLETYTYDGTGNRKSLLHGGVTDTYVYPEDSHRLSSVSGVSRSYDAVGNTINIGGAAYEFIYNGRDRLSQFRQAGAVKASYSYNAIGERVAAGSSPNYVETYTLYDEFGNWIGDYDGAGAAKQQAVWFGDFPVGLIVGNGGGQSLLYVQSDHLGTPRAVVDPDRDVALWSWDAKSEVFGNSSPNQDPDLDGIPFVFDLRFSGQRYDSSTALNYNYFRDYDPAIGRYVQSDPIGLDGGSNTYAYVRSSPVLYSDPRGLVDHTAGRWIDCGKGCRIRIDFTLVDGVKVRHLHWECKGKEGECGEFGKESHGGSWDSVPAYIKQCALKNGFQGSSVPAAERSALSVSPSEVNGALLNGAMAIGTGALLFLYFISGQGS